MSKQKAEFVLAQRKAVCLFAYFGEGREPRGRISTTIRPALSPNRNKSVHLLEVSMVVLTHSPNYLRV